MEVAYLAFDCFCGAYVGIATKKLTDDFVLNAILLRCEGEQGSSGLVELGIRSGVDGDPPTTNFQQYVAKSEGSGIR